MKKFSNGGNFSIFKCLYSEEDLNKSSITELSLEAEMFRGIVIDAVTWGSETWAHSRVTLWDIAVTLIHQEHQTAHMYDWPHKYLILKNSKDCGLTHSRLLCFSVMSLKPTQENT